MNVRYIFSYGWVGEEICLRILVITFRSNLILTLRTKIDDSARFRAVPVKQFNLDIQSFPQSVRVGVTHGRTNKRVKLTWHSALCVVSCGLTSYCSEYCCW